MVADGSFAVLELLAAVRRRMALVTHLRLDARLFAPPPPRTPRTIGRPRVVGVRLPTLSQRLGDRRTRWRRLVVAGWYGGGDRLVEACPGTAPWHHPGLPVVPPRWVLVRDPIGEFRPQAFLCTDLEAEPVQILPWFVRRWATEVTFAEARRHLGRETQRQWSDRAIARTTPALLGLCSLVALGADELHRGSAILPRAATWYAKRAATFSDALAAGRRAIWADAALRTSASGGEAEKVPRAALDRLTDLAWTDLAWTDLACYAA